MMKMFNLILEKNLTPDQFYMMYCIDQSVGPVHINAHSTLRCLLYDGWVIRNNSGLIVSRKGRELIVEVSGYFKKQKAKTDAQVMGENHSEMIDKYLLQFPRKKLPSGKYARVDKRNLEAAFKWFFQNYDYSWDIILEATSRYVHEYEKKNYMYMQTSQYFIRKQQSDKSWTSELANYCSVVQSGQAEEEDQHFSEKVV